MPDTNSVKHNAKEDIVMVDSKGRQWVPVSEYKAQQSRIKDLKREVGILRRVIGRAQYDRDIVAEQVNDAKARLRTILRGLMKWTRNPPLKSATVVEMPRYKWQELCDLETEVNSAVNAVNFLQGGGLASRLVDVEVAFTRLVEDLEPSRTMRPIVVNDPNIFHDISSEGTRSATENP